MEKLLSFKTKYGWVSIKEKNNLIDSVFFGKMKNINFSNKLKKLQKQILDYFKGNKIKWRCELNFSGTVLEKKIWKELQKIPYGSTKSYGQIAKKLKTSPRYVGRVCGKNKYLILVPCHRVICSNGNLGGFSGLGGLKLKEKLLKLENITKY